MRIVRPGSAEGVIFGGNLGTLFLLQGTKYWPKNHGKTILFVEEDDLSGKFTLAEALRRLRSLLSQPNLQGSVAGLVLGRFQRKAQASFDLIERGLKGIAAIYDIPVIINAPFGHTNPMVTIPIGGWAWLDASASGAHVVVACARA